MWKDFFYFTRTERQGIIILIILILAICTLNFFLPNRQEKNTKSEHRARFEKEYARFMSSIKLMKEKNYATNNYNRYNNKIKKEIQLIPFDPNKADSLMLTNLGLPSWITKNIIHYRDKGGIFRKPEDFKKIYGLTEKQYQTLLPYIIIPTIKKPIKEEIKLFAKNPEKLKRSVYKYPYGTVISLNQADTTELKKIPGIGSNIAIMIVNYRQKLGHYYNINQLGEINLSVEKLRPWFSVSEDKAPQINLNRSSLQKMMRHPYINFYQAKAFVEFRKKRGNIKNLKQFALYEEFTPIDFERLTHYVCF
ncbi:MAG: helix-hairpin-helix domain-containing protein [Bacteroidaceae bacterium]|nr:helix-hairpin-helix domain-containing protein [Bacteroidaceae bacterium]